MNDTLTSEGPTSLTALREPLAHSRRAVVFTGAGMSTESDIPDFRSPGGVWSRMQPILFKEFLTSEDKRREAWRQRFDNSDGCVGAKPSSGHEAITHRFSYHCAPPAVAGTPTDG